jgi:hypothetical protein
MANFLKLALLWWRLLTITIVTAATLCGSGGIAVADHIAAVAAVIGTVTDAIGTFGTVAIDVGIGAGTRVSFRYRWQQDCTALGVGGAPVFRERK